MSLVTGLAICVAIVLLVIIFSACKMPGDCAQAKEDYLLEEANHV